MSGEHLVSPRTPALEGPVTHHGQTSTMAQNREMPSQIHLPVGMSHQGWAMGDGP